MNDTKQGFKQYFDKLIQAWQDRFGSRPKLPFEDDLEPSLVVSEPDEEELIEWLPKEVPDSAGSADIEPALRSLLSFEVAQYFSSYWFLGAGGKLGNLKVELTPLTPSYIRDALPDELAGYSAMHGDALSHVPIGFEASSGNVIVLGNSDSDAGVYVEDVDTQEKLQIAESPYDLLARLEP